MADPALADVTPPVLDSADVTTPAPLAPHPGSQEMPRWNVAELGDAPHFSWRNWTSMLGPALLMGGAAIGGGEWLMGPTVTARYGGSLMWLGTLSILGQVIYNIEISRYTLYCGEPIFTGKFRCLPGPRFWLLTYLLLDFGAIFPYLASAAATPVAAIYLGQIPDPANPDHKFMLRVLGMAIFVLAFIPLIFGGKIYNSLKVVMSFKIVSVLGYLLLLGLLFTRPSTWAEIALGFVQIGNVPVQRGEDLNNNGLLDPGEDIDRDGHLDIIEPPVDPKYLVELDLNSDGKTDLKWVDANGDGRPDETMLATLPDGTSRQVALGRAADSTPYLDYDGDKTPDGANVENIFASLAMGRGMPDVDLRLIAYLAAFAAIAGSGGLSNTPTSNYTRDQGWGMGHHVGAIPSMIGGHNLKLSHVGTVFLITPESLVKWKRWYKHIMRDQLVIWMPACFFGLALPSMLSIEFLKRGVIANEWTAAGMTADAVHQRVAASSIGPMAGAFWVMTLFCGFLTLGPTMASSADGVIRRWVDVFWTASGTLRKMDPRSIKYVYFGVLLCYLTAGLLILMLLPQASSLVKVATNIMNFALGFSCWHTLYLNTTLLPKPIRPGWFVRIALFMAGLYFITLGTLTTLKAFDLV